LWAKKRKDAFPKLVVRHLDTAALILCIAVIINIAYANFQKHLNELGYASLEYLARMIIIFAVAYLFSKLVAFFKDLTLKYYERQSGLDYSVRSARTKFQLIYRIINVLIIILAIAAMLMSIPRVREFGSTVLASAGVAGIILGFAAQKSLGTLFAGIQIAITQPVKLGDKIIVDGYFGTIGEITLTYVVLYTWDDKRLIIPINRFLDQTTENWTRSSSEIVGKVKIYADYLLPVDEIRKVVLSWIHESPYWDKRSAGLAVTDATDKSIEIRATFSAKNSDDSWALEVYIREKLIGYIRENYPTMLPTSRLQISDGKSLVKE
jgi:small-conductance mechanosensitive channel